MIEVISPSKPAMSPVAADRAPRISPCEVRIRKSERPPVQIANGDRMPKGSDSNPSTRARVAALSLRALPELAAAKQDVKDGADAPDEGDDDP